MIIQYYILIKNTNTESTIIKQIFIVVITFILNFIISH